MSLRESARGEKLQHWWSSCGAKFLPDLRLRCLQRCSECRWVRMPQWICSWISRCKPEGREMRMMRDSWDAAGPWFIGPPICGRFASTELRRGHSGWDLDFLGRTHRRTGSYQTSWYRVCGTGIRDGSIMIKTWSNHFLKTYIKLHDKTGSKINTHISSYIIYPYISSIFNGDE